MRIDRSATGEWRDALARDWAVCLGRHLPDQAWLAIPNIGEAVEKFLLLWGIDALVLSGGNDAGSCPDRDQTEHAVCRFALRYGLPVLGVCRGLHVLQIFHGGRIKPVPPDHAATRLHSVQARHPLGRNLLGSDTAAVNSFHGQGVHIDDQNTFFEPLMVSEDGFVEAMVHKRDRHLAVQWHPERPLPDPALARRLFHFFSREL